MGEEEDGWAAMIAKLEELVISDFMAEEERALATAATAATHVIPAAPQPKQREVTSASRSSQEHSSEEKTKKMTASSPQPVGLVTSKRPREDPEEKTKKLPKQKVLAPGSAIDAFLF